MKKMLNTLYITRQESYLHKERETIVIKQGDNKLGQFPAITIANILCFGQVSVSPFLMGFCGEHGIGSEGGTKRLRKISKTCVDYGMRVQNSVFECEVTPAQFVTLKNQLMDIFDPDVDSLRFYMLGKKGRQKVEHVGAKSTIDPSHDALIL